MVSRFLIYRKFLEFFTRLWYDRKSSFVLYFDAVKEEQEKNGIEYALHMSIGYFKYTPEIHSVAEFVSAADKYLYRQKNERSLKRAIKETVDNSFKK